MNGLEVSNLIFLTIVVSLILLMIQRSEAKRRWFVALILIVPVGFLLVRWAQYRERMGELAIALGVGLVLNVIFWIVYGRRHPPGSHGEIKVWGQEDV